MASTLDLHTSAHPDAARDLAHAALTEAGVRLTPTGTHSADGERGTRWVTLLFGALAGKASQHLKIQVSTFAFGDSGSIVRVSLVSTGIAAGAIGAARAQTIITELQARVAAALPAAAPEAPAASVAAVAEPR